MLRPLRVLCALLGVIFTATLLRAAPPTSPSTQATTQPVVDTYSFGDGKYHVTITTTDTPDLTGWSRTELAPVVQEWYPKIVDMLPSDGFTAPAKFSITFHAAEKVPAYTMGNRIVCSGNWMRGELHREAIGAVVHEMVHVVQQYGAGRRVGAKPWKNPGYLVEGIPDYIRWFKYEPQTHGADVTARNIARIRYDGSYRTTAAFLDWVTDAYDKDLVKELNAAMRRGAYSDELWKTLTGKSVQDLDAEWREAMAKKLGVPVPPVPADPAQRPPTTRKSGG